MTSKASVLGGLGLGAGLMYLLDPDRGRRRRALVRDQLSSRIGDSEAFLGKTIRDSANRSRGLVARARSRVTPGGRVTDDVLVERVRSKLGRYVSHPGAIEVDAHRGRVVLSGPILAGESEDLLSAVASVPGVHHIENELEVHERPGDEPALQGTGRRTGETSELAQESWSPAFRFAAGTVGAAMTLAGLRRLGFLGAATAAAGAGLMARGVSNRPVRRLTGVGAGRRAVDFQKTVTVDAPLDDVYQVWSRLEEFPRIMSHVREVREIGPGRTRWTAAGPLGTTVSWNAVETARVPGELLAWRSEPGSQIDNAGIVRFEPVGDDATRIDVRLSYNPPAGSVGDVVANVFGVDPKSAMDEDLMRFKSRVEDGSGRGPA
ncbi:MAG: SRPBCC family protein [Gemmatimonadota bacterium]